MGSYLNPGSALFERSLNSKIYVDKSGLIRKMNALIHTEQCYVCVSRPRRFGKSMAANMLAAYYGRGTDTDALFRDLDISGDASYEKYRNQYDVIRINMQEFLSASDPAGDMLAMLKSYLLFDLEEEYREISFRDKNNLIQVMKDIYAKTNHSFVVLIDEWDCLFREKPQNTEEQRNYLDFLRMWLKDQDYIALAYMTGILPIKKYGSHSALNMFTEYSMTDAGEMAEYFGFTDREVEQLCAAYGMSYEEAGAWYDGYHLSFYEDGEEKNVSMYSPKSVVEAMLRHKFGNYWNRTETYEALKIYIQMDIDGLKQAVVKMLAGESVSIETGTFSNDMTTFVAKDDVLTLLVHLGYLMYDGHTECVSIPNKEVAQEYINAIRTMDWAEVTRSVEDSRKLLEALWNLDEERVAEGIERAHNEIPSLEYNDENSLCCTIQLAFYFAREYYTIIREMPAGKGFADLCLIPRKAHADKPAAIIELKMDASAESAIAQIKERKYTEALQDYRGNLLLAGINYDRKTKKHSCRIEKLQVNP